MSVFLQQADYIEFVLRKNLRKAIRPFHGAVNLPMFRKICLIEQIGIHDIRTQAQLGGNLPADGHLVASHHLDLDAHLARRFDGGFGIFA